MILNCDNQRWYSKRLVWPMHASWYFCDQCFVSHYVMTLFTVIKSAKCHWHSHDKFWLIQNHVSVTSFIVMIRDETQSVGATITCLVTLCATHSWSITWSRNFQSVIIAIVVGDMRVSGSMKQNEYGFSLCLSRQYNSRSFERMLILFCLGLHTKYIRRMIITERRMNDRDYHRQTMSWRSCGCWTKCHEAYDWSPKCLSLTSDHLSCVRDLTWASFQS